MIPCLAAHQQSHNDAAAHDLSKVFFFPGFQWAKSFGRKNQEAEMPNSEGHASYEVMVAPMPWKPLGCTGGIVNKIKNQRERCAP